MGEVQMISFTDLSVFLAPEVVCIEVRSHRSPKNVIMLKVNLDVA